jgi:CspA family cold shock protein
VGVLTLFVTREEGIRMEGIVKSWMEDEGVGWIRVEGGDDVWVHFTGIADDPVRFPNGYRFLREGQHVTFDLIVNPLLKEQSRTAINVTIKP